MRTVTVVAVLAIASGLALCIASQAQSLTNNAGLGPAPLQRASAAAASLRDMDLENGDGADPIPGAVRRTHTEFKHAIRDFLLELLNQTELDDPAALEKAAQSALHGAGLYAFSGASSVRRPLPFREVTHLSIERPRGHPELLAAMTTVSLPCDGDSSLYVFQRAGKQWRLVLENERNGYQEIYDALAGIEYAISPPDASGRWYAVIAGVNAACASSWQSIRYVVVRPTENATQGHTLLSRSGSLYLGADEVQKLTAERDWFRISWVGGSIDVDVATRIYVEQYAVGESSIVRVAPYAVRPQDFVEEWMELPWEEASRWTPAQNLARARSWHAKLHRWHPSPEEWLRIQEQSKVATLTDASDRYLKDSPGESFDFVQRCLQPNTWLVGLKLEGGGFPCELFFSLSRRQDAFFIDNVSDVRPGGCPGSAKPRRAGDTLPPLP